MTKTILLTTIILAITVMLFAFPTTQTLYGYDHLTEKTQDIDADGTWGSELAPNEVEHWAFTLSEARDAQYVTVHVLIPSGATVDVYVDGEYVATATNVPPNIVVSLAAGSHYISVENTGDEEVHYSLYLGHINLSGIIVNCKVGNLDVCKKITGALKTGLEAVANSVIHGVIAPITNTLTLQNVILVTSHTIQNNQHKSQKTQHNDLQDTLDDPIFGLEEIKNEVSDIQSKVNDPGFGLEEIKNEIMNIETVAGTKEKVSVTVHLDQVNIKKNEVLVLLDITDSGTLSEVHVAANLPCNGGKPPTAGGSNDAPNVNIVAGEATGTLTGVIDAAADDTGFVGPMKTCVFHATLTAADAGHPITDVILINPGNPQVFPSGTVVTITGTYT